MLHRCNRISSHMAVRTLPVVFLLAVYQVLGSSCDATSNGSCVTKTAEEEAQMSSSSSLLQRVFKRGNASKVTENSIQPNALGCTGVFIQDRCWHQSNVAESCAATCARYGETFSFVLADTRRPLTPLLIGHEPRTKQEAWAALECYVAEEDRYHIANVEAASRYAGDIGAWTDSQCKLACPCTNMPTPSVAARGTCQWKPDPKCAPEFEWKGVKYSGSCATVDHETPWCQHGYYPDNNNKDDWSPCIYDCDARPSPVLPFNQDKCEWNLGIGCVSEFDYQGMHVVGCTAADHDTPWCSLSSSYAGAWNSCSYSCPTNSAEAEKINQEVLRDDQLCSWESRSWCAKPFVYKGISYTGCTDIDHPTPWCSHDQLFRGNWSICKRVCTRRTGPAPAPMRVPVPVPVPYPAPLPVPVPVPVPVPMPAPVQTLPCVKIGYENDVVGSHVTLDEAGYKVLAEFDDTSAGFINTKRFVCRVVDKLNCRVVDEASLSSFVPYWSSLKSHETYAHLEQELADLCRQMDKWVAPLVAPAPAPIPLPQSVPCARDVDLRNDVVGDSVSLDEAGFSAVAQTGTTSNMKRFVCRVVDKILCKVIDEGSLMTFVPYFSSLSNHETYAHLEQELSEICRAGDKWAVPVYSPAPLPAPFPMPVPVAPAWGCPLSPRNPYSNDDIVGNSVTLDEFGYRGVVELDSPSNTKRFTCRVVEKIRCKVVDDASLSAFVPYFFSLSNHETYAHLEQELVELCQAGDKWIVRA